MIAWCFRYAYVEVEQLVKKAFSIFHLVVLRFAAGPLGVLQVDDEYRGRGYGTLVCKAMTKKLGEAGDDVFGCVFEANTPSRKMFENCGFKIVDKVHWIQTYPFEWREEFD